MSFNGSGLYQLPDTIDNGTSNDAPEVMAILTDLATGISQCLTKDGQQTVAANIPMNGFRLTGVGPGQARTDSATVEPRCRGRWRFGCHRSARPPAVHPRRF